MIPKILHHFHFGPTPPSPFLMACRQSLLDLHPVSNDWLHICWDEDGNGWIPGFPEWELERCDVEPDTLGESPAVKALGFNLPCFLNRLLEAASFGKLKNPYGLFSDLMKMLALYQFGGFALDFDMYGIRPLDRFLSEDIVFAQIRESLVSEALIGAAPRDPRIKEAVERYHNEASPETGVASLNLSGFCYYADPPIISYAPDYFIGANRQSQGEELYRVTANTHTLHCWQPHDRYSLERLETIALELNTGGSDAK